MEFPLWKEEAIPDLLCDEQDIELVANRGQDIVIEFDDDDKLTYQQKARLREEEEISKINFENYLIRQQLEEEEQMRQNGEYEESKSDLDDYGDNDDYENDQ